MLGIERVLDRFKPRGLRLLPNYHGYRLSDVSVERIMRLAKQRRMIVQVFQRIADERWHWMLKTPAVDQEALAYFTARYADQPLLLSGLGSFEGWASRIEQSDSIYVDVSRIRGPVFAIERLQQSVRLDRVVFGSLWPIQMIEASLWQIEAARLDVQNKAALLRDNANRLLAGANEA
jgi:predicted TIM-barrel fold metal-dependent hydrolase